MVVELDSGIPSFASSASKEANEKSINLQLKQSHLSRAYLTTQMLLNQISFYDIKTILNEIIPKKSE